MNVSLIIWGLFFFLNPLISVVDPLPDFIGAILILCGISRIVKFDERSKSARGIFLTLVYVSILRTVSLLLGFIIDKSEFSWYLVLSFVFGILEAVLTIWGVLKLVGSISYQGMRSGCLEVSAKESYIKGLTVTFFVLRTIMAILPQLTYLSSDFGEVKTFEINWDFINKVLMGMNIVVILLFGLFWFISIAKYFKAVGRNEPFGLYLNDRYENEYHSNNALVLFDRLKTVSALFCVGIAFSAALRLDGIDYLPDFICAAFLLWALTGIYKLYKKEVKPVLIVSCLYIVFSAAEWIISTWFSLSNYNMLSETAPYSESVGWEVQRNIDLYYIFIGICILYIIKEIFFAATVFLSCKNLRKIVKVHTGAISELRSERTAAKTAEIQKVQQRNITVFIVLSALSAVISSAAFVLQFSVPILWGIDLCVSIVLFVVAKVFFDRLRSGIEYKYFFN